MKNDAFQKLHAATMCMLYSRPVRALRKAGIIAPNTSIPKGTIRILRDRYERIMEMRSKRRKRKYDDLAGRESHYRNIALRRETQRMMEKRERRRDELNNYPCRFKSSLIPRYAADGTIHSEREWMRSCARRICAIVAHELIKKGASLSHCSESGSFYLLLPGKSSWDERVRISDHQLGWADYGTREQVHCGGREFVLLGNEEPSALVSEILDGKFLMKDED